MTPVPTPEPTAHPTARPSPSPIDPTNPDHSWDFRTCNSSSTTLSDTYGGLTATLVNGAQCTTDGIVFDGSDDYVDLEDWEWGGTVSFELYAKWDALQYWSRLIDFGDGANANNVLISNTVS